MSVVVMVAHLSCCWALVPTLSRSCASLTCLWKPLLTCTYADWPGIGIGKRHIGSDAFSLGGQHDQKSVRSVDDFPWLGSVVWISFSALTLLVLWEECHLPWKTLSTYSQWFSSEQMELENWRELANSGSSGRWPLKCRWSTFSNWGANVETHLFNQYISVIHKRYQSLMVIN